MSDRYDPSTLPGAAATVNRKVAALALEMRIPLLTLSCMILCPYLGSKLTKCVNVNDFDLCF